MDSYELFYDSFWREPEIIIKSMNEILTNTRMIEDSELRAVAACYLHYNKSLDLEEVKYYVSIAEMNNNFSWTNYYYAQCLIDEKEYNLALKALNKIKLSIFIDDISWRKDHIEEMKCICELHLKGIVYSQNAIIKFLKILKKDDFYEDGVLELGYSGVGGKLFLELFSLLTKGTKKEKVIALDILRTAKKMMRVEEGFPNMSWDIINKVI